MCFSLYPLTISRLLWCTKCMKLALHQPLCLFPSNCIVIIIFLDFYDRLTLLPLSRLPICSWFSLRTHGTSWSLVSLVPYEKGAVWWLPNRLTAPNFCYSVMHCTWIISWGKRGGCWDDNWGSFYLLTAPNFCYSVMHCTWIISWGKRGGCWDDNWGSFYLIVITFH